MLCWVRPRLFNRCKACTRSAPCVQQAAYKGELRAILIVDECVRMLEQQRVAAHYSLIVGLVHVCSRCGRGSPLLPCHLPLTVFASAYTSAQRKVFVCPTGSLIKPQAQPVFLQSLLHPQSGTKEEGDVSIEYVREQVFRPQVEKEVRASDTCAPSTRQAVPSGGCAQWHAHAAMAV